MSAIERELPADAAVDAAAGPERPGRLGRGTLNSKALRRALRPGAWVPALIGLGAVAVIWQLVAVHNPDLIPTIGAIASDLVRKPGFFARNALVTIQETAVGLGVSFALAFVLAVIMCHLRPFEKAVMPVVVVLNVTPVVAIAPALVVAFGFGMTPKYIVTGMIVFFPILVNSLVGLRSIDPQALDVLRTLHASRLEILYRLRLPSSLPYLFAAARVCFPVSVIGAVVAEFAASGQQRGLGSVIQTSAALSDLPPIYAAIACLAAIGLALTFLVTLLESRLLSWHVSKRQSS